MFVHENGGADEKHRKLAWQQADGLGIVENAGKLKKKNFRTNDRASFAFPMVRPIPILTRVPPTP